ncbi:MAG: hypothetical protein ACRYG8_44185, partial [Janthinobacterium lividum]
MTEADARLARADTLLREANRDRAKELQDRQAHREQVMLEAAMEEVRKQGVSHSIHQVFSRKADDGTDKLEVLVYREAPQEIVDLMDNPEPILAGLIWEGLSNPDRVDMLKQLDLEPDLVFSESVLDVLPDKSKAYLLGWQQQVNSGATWEGSLS